MGVLLQRVETPALLHLSHTKHSQNIISLFRISVFTCKELVKTMGALGVNEAWSRLAVKVKLDLRLSKLSHGAGSGLSIYHFDKGQ